MKLIVCIFLLAISFTAIAQRPGQRHKKWNKEKWDKDKSDLFRENIPYMYKTLGGSLQTFDGINDRVAGLPQYEQLKDYAATIGLGWLKESKQFISAFGFGLGSSMSGHRDEKSSTIRYISFNIDIGYDFIKNERFMLYPLIGLGAQKYQAVFFKDNTAVDFDDVLTSPDVQNSITPVKFTNPFLLYRVGLGFTVKAPRYPAAIGIQAGYTRSFTEHEWRSNDNQELANAPEDMVSQFYISLVLMNKPFSMIRR